MSWYINEARNGHEPNVRVNPETYEVCALRDIHDGDELTTRYDDYSDRPQTISQRKRNPKRETALPGRGVEGALLKNNTLLSSLSFLKLLKMSQQINSADVKKNNFLESK